MNRRKGKKRIAHLWTISVAVLIILAGFTGSAYCWDHERTHKEHLTGEALNLLKDPKWNKEYSPEIWDETFGYASYIMHGAMDEDLPCELFAVQEGAYDMIPFVGPAIREALIAIRDRPRDQAMRIITQDLRSNNHYGHAIAKGVGLTCSALYMGDNDTDPLKWAKTNLFLDPEEEFKGGSYWWNKGWNKDYGNMLLGIDVSKQGWSAEDLDNGNMSWEKAINRYGYNFGAKQLAYYTLGFVLHLLQDMGEPEHVHDDPHGGSSYTGFEKYMAENWDKEDNIKSSLTNLRPWQPKDTGTQGGSFSDIDDYFDRLGKISYSATRFKGYINDPTKIEEGSDLDKMFDLHYIIDPSTEEIVWMLTNKRTALADSHSPYRYRPLSFGKDPPGHKGGDGGEWWPTSRELENCPDYSKKLLRDAEGYYYIELSDDLPFKDVSKPWPFFSNRNLYPMAYLPTPLKDVKEEFGRWITGPLNGKTHLYQILAKNLARPVVEYSAGLIQHYFDIVNHPPYVKSVEVKQGNVRYYAQWYDMPEERNENKTVSDVGKRGLNTLIEPSYFSTFRPGEILVTITFSEPVDNLKVEISGAHETGEWMPAPEDVTWTGLFEIYKDGPQSEALKIKIEARDRNRHYEDEDITKDGQLDKEPETPAKRRVTGKGTYTWGDTYQPGLDEKHVLQVRREVATIRKIEPRGPVLPGKIVVGFRPSDRTDKLLEVGKEFSLKGYLSGFTPGYYRVTARLGRNVYTLWSHVKYLGAAGVFEGRLPVPPGESQITLTSSNAGAITFKVHRPAVMDDEERVADAQKRVTQLQKELNDPKADDRTRKLAELAKAEAELAYELMSHARDEEAQRVLDSAVSHAESTENEGIQLRLSLLARLEETAYRTGDRSLLLRAGEQRLNLLQTLARQPQQNREETKRAFLEIAAAAKLLVERWIVLGGDPGTALQFWVIHLDALDASGERHAGPEYHPEWGSG